MIPHSRVRTMGRTIPIGCSVGMTTGPFVVGGMGAWLVVVITIQLKGMLGGAALVAGDDISGVTVPLPTADEVAAMTTADGVGTTVVFEAIVDMIVGVAWLEAEVLA